ncbi:hypothetical protein QW3_1522 [Clostridioides difficile P74]|nr:hypothetical protein QUY_1576 [Clostridioides difficile P71]EQK32523.1 hypothetical protein QW3_1522 [Clostridioides difficile P74]
MINIRSLFMKLIRKKYVKNINLFVFNFKIKLNGGNGYEQNTESKKHKKIL